MRKSDVVCAGVVVEGDVGGGGGVDEKKESLSPRKTAKRYRKAGKFQRKLRSAWALLGVRPYLVQPGEDGDECVLTSKVEADYVLKTTVDAEYVLKSAAEVCEDCDGERPHGRRGGRAGDCSGDCFGTKENDACGTCGSPSRAARPSPSPARRGVKPATPRPPSSCPRHDRPTVPSAPAFRRRCDADGSFCANSPEARRRSAIVEVVGTAEAASKFFAEMIDGLAERAVTAVKPPTTKDDGSASSARRIRRRQLLDGAPTTSPPSPRRRRRQSRDHAEPHVGVRARRSAVASTRSPPRSTPPPAFDVDVGIKQPSAKDDRCGGARASTSAGKKTCDASKCGGDAREGVPNAAWAPSQAPPATDPPVRRRCCGGRSAADPPVTDPPATSCEWIGAATRASPTAADANDESVNTSRARPRRDCRPFGVGADHLDHHSASRVNACSTTRTAAVAIDENSRRPIELTLAKSAPLGAFSMTADRRAPDGRDA